MVKDVTIKQFPRGAEGYIFLMSNGGGLFSQ